MTDSKNNDVPSRPSIFKLPDHVLKRIDTLIRDNPRRMAITLELFEAQHHHTQETLEAWVLKRLDKNFEGTDL